MARRAPYRYEFKRLDSPAEQEQVNRLLYRTFVLEIARYENPGADSLVDRFHKRNVYFIAVCNQQVCGALAVHDGPDFSITKALPDPSKLSSLTGPNLEARIFAVEPDHRFGIVFGGLAKLTLAYAIESGYRHMLITGLATKQKMYERMGFDALGPATKRGGDYFVPMAMKVNQVPDQIQDDIKRFTERY